MSPGRSAVRRQLDGRQSLEQRIIGRSDGIRRLRELLLNVADTSANVLIHGETGTGKELVASCLHDFSRRKDHQYVAINCGGLPENLPRCLPEGVHAAIDPHSWERPDLFRWLQEAGEVPEEDLWNTFNLGVGFCLVLPADALAEALAISRGLGFAAWELGAVMAGPAPGHPLAGLPY